MIFIYYSSVNSTFVMWSHQATDNIIQWFYKAAFTVTNHIFKLTSQVSIDHLEVALNDESSSSRRLIGFADPCTSDEFPGWPLRNLLVLVSIQQSLFFWQLFQKQDYFWNWNQGALNVPGITQYHWVPDFPVLNRPSRRPSEITTT